MRLDCTLDSYTHNERCVGVASDGDSEPQRCTLGALGLPAALEAQPDLASELIWQKAGEVVGWWPWSRATARTARVLLWSACANQVMKHSREGGAPGDSHINDFWPTAPHPPTHPAHRDVPITAWQAAFLADLVSHPTAATRIHVDATAARYGCVYN